MDILYLLLPMSVLLALGVLALFAWALHGGQFEDLEREGLRVLDEPGAADPVPDPAGRTPLP
ncbi:MAG TPA: cbb3-type cytochrome oxidase assembly protein CcoS [Methylibium sp.]|jgi:cbb3-type cytochrome oxidase maturation protein|nr:cbb3-type cytochrome oxidase assembly protein CcoS [Methylibium sp.]